MAGAATPASGEPTPPATWRACAGELRGLQCANVRVPLDHADPDGPTITLAISRRRHTARPFLGVVVTNPGGPGAPGRDLAAVAPSIAGRDANRFDWIGIDPRGVGGSRPALRCAPAMLRAPTPPSTALGAWERRSQRYAASCGAAPSAVLLPHMTTENLAHDIDVVRRALRVERISYYGASYGTVLGQVYASLHPQRVHRMILDGVVDAHTPYYVVNRSQRSGFEANHRSFLTWVARNRATYRLGSDPRAIRARINARLAKLRRNPPASGPGASEIEKTFVMNTYAPHQWPMTAVGLSHWLRSGDRTAMDGDRMTDNMLAAYLAIECRESPSPPWNRLVADAARDVRVAPLGTWQNMFQNGPCAFWPVPVVERPPVDGSRLTAPILLVHETRDAATPYRGALTTRALFPNARLVAVRGGLTHSGATFGGSCVRRATAAYLVRGTVPPRRAGVRADRVCAPVPMPQPVAP